MRPVILVTGAGRGLGRGISEYLAEQGYSVAINYSRSAKPATETVASCEAKQIHDDQVFAAVQGSVAESADHSRLLSETLERFGRLDAVVHNAGISSLQRNDLTSATEESWDTVMGVNLKGPFFLTQAIANHWLDGGEASLLPAGYAVIFVSSISAHTATTARGDYCISKAGMSMMAQLWATRLAGEGMQVFELRPGIMTSGMTSGVTDKYDRLIAEGLVPQGRWGTGEDLGKAVCSLVDGDFPFSTGAVIDVDGGFQLRRL
jgi:NAD(P)-dependent dehydrogenase (short-subunit alcohol dehydrogenase family)